MDSWICSFSVLCLLIISVSAGCINNPQSQNNALPASPIITGSSPTSTLPTPELSVTQQNAINATKELPWITIDPITDHKFKDTFIISGSTNLPEGDELLVEVYSPLDQGSCFCIDKPCGAVGTIKIVKGDGGINHWNFFVNTAGEFWKSDTQNVVVSAIRSNERAYATFNLSTA